MSWWRNIPGRRREHRSWESPRSKGRKSAGISSSNLHDLGTIYGVFYVMQEQSGRFLCIGRRLSLYRWKSAFTQEQVFLHLTVEVFFQRRNVMNQTNRKVYVIMALNLWKDSNICCVMGIPRFMLEKDKKYEWKNAKHDFAILRQSMKPFGTLQIIPWFVVYPIHTIRESWSMITDQQIVQARATTV